MIYYISGVAGGGLGPPTTHLTPPSPLNVVMLLGSPVESVLTVTHEV